MKSRSKLRAISVVVMAAVFIIGCPLMAFAAEEGADTPAVYATFCAAIPPLAAIILALITKEVYSSLFIGISIGALLYTGGHPGHALVHLVNDGFIAALTDSYNVGILIFLVLLGGIVALLNKTGGSAAFGEWAASHIKTPMGAQFATIALGMLIFVDDYFNCLTVGSVMTPLTEKHGVTKAKMAYLIDATAAPICTIAPISSWAAAVTGFVEGQNGFTLFLKAIPFNFYAILTICMMLFVVGMKFDYGTMKKYQDKMQENIAAGEVTEANKDVTGETNGRVIDLVAPVVILIICCIMGMLYTGGIFAGENFINAFANADAAQGLAIGSLLSVLLIIVYYLFRRVIKFNDAMECIPEGFIAMVAPISILTLAWTLKNMTDGLGLAPYVEGITQNLAGSLIALLPAVVFAIACVLGFSSGTSWGTFGILIPVVVAVFENDPQMLVLAMSACMAGGVAGDHCSPISDTTIMASAGARCNHVDHVSTQLPYAITVASVAFVTYIVAGLTKSAFISLPFGIIALFCVLLVLKKRQQKIDAAA